VSNQEVLIRLTVPTQLITRHSRHDTAQVRKAIDQAFRVTLGRCDWKEPVVITCRPKQFGIFVATMFEMGLYSLLGMMSVVMFEEDKAAKPHVFDARNQQPMKLSLKKMAIPISDEVEVS
jgi:hypothetical protein